MPNTSNNELDTVRILVARIQDGDDAARSELAAQVQAYLSMMAEKAIDDRIRKNVGPSDVVQMTLINMVEGIDRFNGKSTPEFFAWLNKIVKNEARKAARDLKRQKRDIRRQQSMQDQDHPSRAFGGMCDPQATPQSAAISEERIQLFHEALSRLSDDYATVIRLRNLEQLEFKEIAEKMNRTVNAVSKIWYRAIMKFEQELEMLDGQSRH